MSRYPIISFDADQTLFDFHRVMIEALDAVCGHVETTYGIATTANELKAQRDQLAAEVNDPAISMLELRRMSFHNLLSNHRIDDPVGVGGMMQVFEEIRFGTVHFYDDTLPVLKRLSQFHELALVTNGNSSATRSQVDDYFTYSILAEDHGFRKPDKRLFDVLLSQADICPDQLIHVGDSLETDVQGALNTGATAVYLNRAGAPNSSSITPHYEVASLTEIHAILES